MRTGSKNLAVRPCRRGVRRSAARDAGPCFTGAVTRPAFDPPTFDPEAPRPQRLTALVSGQVQGVGYRRYAQRRASDLGLSGFAENLRDGKVEVVAEGPRPELDHLLHFLRRGPPHARVQAVEEQWSESTGLSGFYVY